MNIKWIHKVTINRNFHVEWIYTLYELKKEYVCKIAKYLLSYYKFTSQYFIAGVRNQSEIWDYIQADFSLWLNESSRECNGKYLFYIDQSLWYSLSIKI